jgi:hypothetical protein
MFCYIYKLIKKNAENDDMIYIGSSCDIDTRWKNHKKNCNNPNSKDYYYKVYEYIRENGGIDEWKMIILDEFEIPLIKCVERDELENKYIKKYDTINKLNKVYACLNIDERNDKNKIRCKNYYYDNIDNRKEKSLENYKKNREVRIKQMKEPIVCNLCGTFSTKTHLKRHQQTQKCKNKSSHILDDEP